MHTFRLLLLCVALLGYGRPSHAEHPIDVERLSAAGEHLQALAVYDRIPKRVCTTSAAISAARSAWALGLTDKATSELDQLLRREDLSAAQRTEALFTRAIVEFQEGRHQVADLYAEKALHNCAGVCPQRSAILLLSGESLASQGAYGAAESKFTAALENVSANQMPEIYYQRGVTRVRLGKLSDARSDLEQVPLQHERTPEALRALAGVALDSADFAAVIFWLEKGRALYPQRFLDSWVDYALIESALHQEDFKTVTEVQQNAVKRYAPSDPWMTLLSASLEAHAWEGRVQ